MNIPDMLYNQGNTYHKTDTPYMDIYHRVEMSRWSGVGHDQNGNKVLMLAVIDHEWDCCCVACIDDETVTEHLEWIDWYRRTQLTRGEEE